MARALIFTRCRIDMSFEGERGRCLLRRMEWRSTLEIPEAWVHVDVVRNGARRVRRARRVVGSRGPSRAHYLLYTNVELEAISRSSRSALLPPTVCLHETMKQHVTSKDLLDATTSNLESHSAKVLEEWFSRPLHQRGVQKPDEVTAPRTSFRPMRAALEV